MSLRLSVAGCLFLFSFFAGCVSPPSKFSYAHPAAGPQGSVSLLEKVDEIEKKDSGNIHIETLSQNALSSHHLVIIRGKEPLHYHVSHDGWAMVLRGKGDFLLGERHLKLRPGSSVFIPRGIRHQAIRRGKEPLAAFVIFTPPFDGKDTVPVEEK